MQRAELRLDVRGDDRVGWYFRGRRFLPGEGTRRLVAESPVFVHQGDDGEIRECEDARLLILLRHDNDGFRRELFERGFDLARLGVALREGREELAEIDVGAAGLQGKGAQERQKVLTVHGRIRV